MKTLEQVLAGHNDKANGERKPTIFRGGIASRLDKATKEMV